MRITKENLSRYNQHFKSWQRRRLGYGKALENWHQTEKAGAVAFYPVGGSPLEGKVKFSFKETGPASGTKGPDNPSSINGVDKIKFVKAGKNFFAPASGASFSNVGNIQNLNGVSMTTLPDFAYSFTGTASADALFYLRYNGNDSGIPVKNNKTYTFSGCPSGGSASTYFMAWHPAVGGNVYDYGDGVTVINPKVTATLHSFNCQVYIKSGTTVSDLIFRPQVEFGNSKTEYEIPEVSEPVIDLGSTYYGGEIDLTTGVMTVTMQYMVADSNTDIAWIGTNYVAWKYPAGLDCIGRAVGTEVCSHFPFNGAWDGSFAHFYATQSSGLYIANPNWTASTCRQYFTDQYNNGTPVTACYQLATPLTVQLDPLALSALAQTSRHEPRLNTIYTNADSIQITYQKSPIRVATEQEMAILGLGGNV